MWANGWAWTVELTALCGNCKKSEIFVQKTMNVSQRRRWRRRRQWQRPKIATKHSQRCDEIYALSLYVFISFWYAGIQGSRRNSRPSRIVVITKVQKKTKETVSTSGTVSNQRIAFPLSVNHVFCMRAYFTRCGCILFGARTFKHPSSFISNQSRQRKIFWKFQPLGGINKWWCGFHKTFNMKCRATHIHSHIQTIRNPG